MNDIDQDRNLQLALLGVCLDPVDLVVVAVHERDPDALVVGVAALRFVEQVGHDRRGVLDHAGGQPLALRLGRRHRLLLGAGEYVLGRARRGRHVVYGTDLGDPLAIALLAAREPGLELRRGSLRRLGGRWAQRARSHHDPLAIGRDHQHVVIVVRLAQRVSLGAIEVLDGPPPLPWSQVVVVVVAVRNRRLCTDFSRAPAHACVRARPSGSPAAWSASYSTGERIPSVECSRVGL